MFVEKIEDEKNENNWECTKCEFKALCNKKGRMCYGVGEATEIYFNLGDKTYYYYAPIRKLKERRW